VADDDTDLRAATAPLRSTTGAVGLVLDGRYRLQRRQGRDGASSTWDGHDEALERTVSVRVVAGATALEAVDAARRAAAVEDVRLPRVLDVGTTTAADGSPLGWVVTERPVGLTLAELVRDAPLPAEQVRAIVGEAAAALAQASAAGVHHRRLDPTSVVVSSEGAVAVVGLEVAAAAAGQPPVGAADADREDAVGLVSLLYAGLTGLWPHGRFSALGAAPLAERAPVPPGDLVRGVPNDLDTLAAVSLGPHGDGPFSPAELVEELAPWGPAAGPSVQLPTGSRPAPARLPGSRPLAGAAGVEEEGDLASLFGPAGPAGPLTDEDDPEGEPVPRRTGRVVLALVGAAVVALLVLAVANLSDLGGALGIVGSGTGGDGRAAGAPPTAEQAAAPPQPLAVAAASALDPLGDDSENDDDVPLVLDGDPATAWSSETYSSADLGGLKEGVGLALDLGQEASVSGVDLGLAGGGATVEVRTSPDGRFEGSTVVATAEGAAPAAGQPVAVDLPSPAATRWVVLWFTALPQTDDGFRVDLSSVAVR